MAKTSKKAKPAKRKVAKSSLRAKAKAKPALRAAHKKAPLKKAAIKNASVTKSVKPAAKPSAKKAALPRVGGLPDELYEAAMKILHDRQAEEITSFSLAGRSSMADYLIIASGRASRQMAAIAEYLREAFMKLGVRQVRIEGLPEGNWVLVDAGDIVVHLFRPEVRRYYRLDDIWTEEPKTPAKAAFTNE